MIALQFYGGFGEKGRTCMGLATGRTRVLFDAGIKVGAAGDDYHPAIAPDDIPRLDAVFIGHAHEDHIGALSFLLARGFRGRLFMSHASWADAPAMQKLYARPEDLPHFRPPAGGLQLFRPGERLACGDLVVRTGRSGHVPGGAWYLAETDGRRVLYCGDVVPHSPVLVMDPLPAADVVVLDGSYGGDDHDAEERDEQIRRWLRGAAGGALLPLPVAGKPLEILALIEGPVAIHRSMFAPIRAQLARQGALHPAAVRRIRKALQGATPWSDGEPLPGMPLLVWDGMGAHGPAAAALAQAEKARHPILLTGHIPDATPARRLHDAGLATWIRLPTHPVASESGALWRATGAARVLAHSADARALAALKAFVPPLDTDARTGGTLTLTPTPRNAKTPVE